MKNTFKTKLVLFIFIILMLLSPLCHASASSIELEDSTSEESTDETYTYIASDVYEFDENITIDSIIDGNAFAFGNNITISGEIGGDVFAFGGNVNVTDTAYIHGSIFVFAKDITMNGICYDVYAASETFTLGEDAIVSRDFRVGADKVYMNGQIKRDAYIGTNELVFPENVSGLISGNLSYTADSEFAISNGIVGGNINYTPSSSEEVSIAEKIASYITNLLSTLLYSLAVVLLAIWLAPNFKEKATKILKKKAPLSFGVGLLTSIVIVIAVFAFILITGGLGVGISFAVATIFILALTISKTVFGMALAKLISTKFKKDNNIIFVCMTLLVVLGVSILEFIPYIGGFIGFIACMLGLGIIVLNLITRQKTDESKLEESSNSSVNE